MRDRGLVPFEARALRRGGMRGEADARPPFGRRADRTRRKAAAAIRADIEQLRRHAIGAEGALVAADAGIARRGRQVLVATIRNWA